MYRYTKDFPEVNRNSERYCMKYRRKTLKLGVCRRHKKCLDVNKNKTNILFTPRHVFVYKRSEQQTRYFTSRISFWMGARQRKRTIPAITETAPTHIK